MLKKIYCLLYKALKICNYVLKLFQFSFVERLCLEFRYLWQTSTILWFPWSTAFYFMIFLKLLTLIATSLSLLKLNIKPEITKVKKELNIFIMSSLLFFKWLFKILLLSSLSYSLRFCKISFRIFLISLSAHYPLIVPPPHSIAQQARSWHLLVKGIPVNTCFEIICPWLFRRATLKGKC